ncbi:unnamed protein product [Durusdinium trenchii]|uniref:C3H1-type domain-containing protein n=1 Tax=Durusdinium trenchii TaxID=1381693 RepID=A0ABP0PQJ7_9DINO
MAENDGSLVSPAELHERGQCKPCPFWVRPNSRCHFGARCHFCHLCGEKDLKIYYYQARKEEKWKNPQAGLPRADDPENGAWPAGPVPTPRERESFEPGFARARADQEVPKDWHLPVQRWQQNWQVIPQELFFQVKENKLIFWM